MSLDYPFYEQLVRRGHRATWWWLVGDQLYYLGLLPAPGPPCWRPVQFRVGLARRGAVTFVAGAAVFVIGSSLKWRL